MDTLSTSVTSTVQIPGFPSTTSTSRELHQFKPLPPYSHHIYHKSSSISNNINRPTSSFTNKSFINCTSTSSPFSSSRLQISSSLKPTTRVEPDLHRKASTGYAAALLDIAQCNNALHVVGRDVRRFLKLLRSDDFCQCFVDDKMKGEVVKEIAVKGRFQKHLVVMVKMLVDKKNQVWMVNEVLEEFQRIYDELRGKTRVGFVV